MFYWTSSKRSRPFWLVIGAIKLLCFSARERAPDLGVISCVLIYTQSIRSSAVWLFREALYTRCDYLTGKYAGPFAGIITVAHLTLLLWCSYQTRDRPFPFSKSIFLEDIHQQKRPQLDNSESMNVCKLPRKPAGEAELFTSSAPIVVRKSFIFFDSLCFLFVVFLFHINKVINKLSLMKN